MLFSLGKEFPGEPSHWDVESPALGLDLSLRLKIKRHLGALQAQDDLNIIKSPSRMGTSIRPYEIGDPVRVISRNHFIKTGQLLSRIDASPGREKAIVFFHGYDNMAFKSQHSTANKGQIGLALAGIIETMHKYLGHSWEWHCVRSNSLSDSLNIAKQRKRGIHYVYVISDYLNQNAADENFLSELCDELVQVVSKKINYLVVRDKLESPINNPLEKLSSLLSPFSDKDQVSGAAKFSGQEYTENLRDQYAEFKENLSKINVDANMFTGETTIETTVNLLSGFLTKGDFRR